MNGSEISELIPGLPEEIGLECLIRLHYATHGVASQVCRRWRQLFQSGDFYRYRKQTGRTCKAACLVQSVYDPLASDGSKRVGSSSYGITVFDPASGSWDRVPLVTKFSDGLPLFCQITSSQRKLVLMGGWDPQTYEPIKDVFVYEFTTQEWKQGKDMPETRSFFAVGELGGRIIVAGGHDQNKNALSTAWAYDVNRNEWSELPRMNQERDECEGVVIGSEFWVISGYRTESQGVFEGSADVMERGTGEWRRVEDAWRVSQCPRSSVGVGKEKKLFSWAGCDSAIRSGVCGIAMGEWALLCGSAYQGAPQGLFLVEEISGKMMRIHVPVEFSGFVQSGCFVEI